jgi:hypothetical protein
LNVLRAAKSVSKSAQCAFKIWREQLYYVTKADCVALGLYDKIEQLPPYFECALSNFRDVLNVHRASLGASMISLEQEKNAPNWEAANKIRLSLY